MCKMLIKLNEVTNATKEVIDATTKLNSDLPTRWRPDSWSNRPELDQQTGSTFLKAWHKCALLLIHSECPVIVRLSFMSHYFVPRFSELLTLSRTHLRYLADLTWQDRVEQKGVLMLNACRVYWSFDYCPDDNLTKDCL